MNFMLIVSCYSVTAKLNRLACDYTFTYKHYFWFYFWHSCSLSVLLEPFELSLTIPIMFQGSTVTKTAFFIYCRQLYNLVVVVLEMKLNIEQFSTENYM